MIEVLTKSKETIKTGHPADIELQDLDFHVIHVIDYDETEIEWVEATFGVDCAIMQQYEDIEISSHFLVQADQVSFHISLPYYNENKVLVESPIFFIIAAAGLFFFSNSEVDAFFNKTYSYKIPQLQKIADMDDVLKLQIEFIADHYADITETETKKVKALANTILIEKHFSKDVMDLITRYNFNNLLLKESLIETTRVFNLYKRSSWQHKAGVRETIESEVNDLSVVSDYIQFNFERLDDLKENVMNKIDLEQNHIFKMLTVVTVCISLPTLIAGIYGMNFKYMPELESSFGYPLAVAAMICAAVVPFIYFRRKKWL